MEARDAVVWNDNICRAFATENDTCFGVEVGGDDVIVVSDEQIGAMMWKAYIDGGREVLRGERRCVGWRGGRMGAHAGWRMFSTDRRERWELLQPGLLEGERGGRNVARVFA